MAPIRAPSLIPLLPPIYAGILFRLARNGVNFKESIPGDSMP
jgi:hypothetical protein